MAAAGTNFLAQWFPDVMGILGFAVVTPALAIAILRRSPSRWFPVVVATLGLTVIAPALWSGWSGDDAYYSALDGILGADRISLAHAMVHSYDVWFFGSGRFYPGLIVEKYLVFCLFSNLIAYKAFLVAMTLIAVELFRRCVAAYFTRSTGNLAALIVVTLFAERGYQDPILAYNAMPQFVAIAFLLSLMAFRRAILEGGAAFWFASAGCYAIAALTYEDVFPLCAVYPAIALFAGKSRREAMRTALPFVAIAGALIILALLMRTAARIPPGSNYAIGADPLSIVRTATIQIVAAFPLSYWLFDPSGIYGRASVGDFLRNAPVSPIVFVAFGIAGWFALREAVRQAVSTAPLLWIGATIAVLPALPIAMTVKYQRELRLGLGYLPVFFEVFGVALIGAALVTAIARRYPSPRVRAALAIAIAVCGTITQATNVRLVAEGLPARAARAALERQVAGGLVADLSDGAAVAIAPAFDWIAFSDGGPEGISTRGLFYSYGGKRIVLVRVGDARARYVLTYRAATQRWSIAHER